MKALYFNTSLLLATFSMFQPCPAPFVPPLLEGLGFGITLPAISVGGTGAVLETFQNLMAVGMAAGFTAGQTDELEAASNDWQARDPNGLKGFLDAVNKLDFVKAEGIVQDAKSRGILTQNEVDTVELMLNPPGPNYDPIPTYRKRTTRHHRAARK